MSPRPAEIRVVADRERRRRGWTGRLQQVRLRTKIAVPTVLLAVLPAIAVGALSRLKARDHVLRTAIEDVLFDTDAKASLIAEFVDGVQRDLRFLGTLPEIAELADCEASDTEREKVDGLRASAAHAMSVFMQGKRAYYQLRYINEKGREAVRLNSEGGHIAIAPVDVLQAKAHRYYVREALVLEPGRIYVSPMDLNWEHGVIEDPPKRVVRYATRVAGVSGEERGVVVVNLSANELLSLVGPIEPGTEAWLIDASGTCLGHLPMGDIGAARFPIGPARGRVDNCDPSVVDELLANAQGDRYGTLGDYLVSVSEIHYDQAAASRHWKLVLSRPKSALESPLLSLTRLEFMVVALVLIIAVVLGIFLGDYVTRPIEKLRQATDRIAAGNLDEHVEIRTADEIEELAQHFNTMTQELRSAHDRLANWNEQLAHEVEAKTEDLQRIQSGLARTDKLASIGQMTSGVMHEIGNPLAAIKTKIQVAQEIGVDSGCSVLLSEIVAEVDRLAGFLHSFSRLSRPTAGASGYPCRYRTGKTFRRSAGTSIRSGRC